MRLKEGMHEEMARAVEEQSQLAVSEAMIRSEKTKGFCGVTSIWVYLGLCCGLVHSKTCQSVKTSFFVPVL